MTTNKKTPNPVDVHVGRRVKIRRVLSGLSQTALAEQLGVTFQQQQKYETGANRISASRLYDTARVLDVPVAWFFGGDLDPDNAEPPDLLEKRETLELVRAIQCLPEDARKKFRAAINAVAEIYRVGQAPAE